MPMNVGRVLASFVLLAIGAAGGEDASRFSSQSGLVLVPVIVRDKSGKHVEKLSQDAFTIYQDGKAQKVSVFQEVHATDNPIARPYGKSEFGNEVGQDVGPHRLVVVVVDAINTSVWSQKGAQVELLKFLEKETQSSEPTGILLLTSTGVEVVQEFTTDPRLLAGAVKKLRAESPMLQAERDRSMDEMAMQAIIPSVRDALNDGLDTTPDVIANPRVPTQQDENQDANLKNVYSGPWGNMIRAAAKQRGIARRARLQVTIEQMDRLSSALEGLPGRKAMIWLTAGVPLSAAVGAPEGWSTARETENSIAFNRVGASIGTSDDSKFSTTPNVSQVGITNSLNEQLARILNNSNIAVYPVDVTGWEDPRSNAVDTSTAYGASSLVQTEDKDSKNDQQGGMLLLAKRTGGKACLGQTEFSRCIFEAYNDAGDYYLLGYDLNPKQSPEGLHKLRVDVRQGKFDVRHRATFSVTNGATSTESLDSVLRSPLEYTGIQFRGEWLKTMPKGDKRMTKFALRIPPSSLRTDDSAMKSIDFDIAAVVLDRDGKIVGEKRQKIVMTPRPEQVESIKKDGIAYTNVLEVPAGTYDVHFVISDNSSHRIGSAVTRISAP
jgi:VWFA-related protein